jgi:hypothetical protein
MPNTLAHYGIQSLISKGVFRPADVKWIGVGCLIPDLPWIFQRLIAPLHAVDPIDLRLYVIIQSSLVMSLIFAGALSLQVHRSTRLFFLLAFNCLLHLLLDPTQTKWANGTHLLAPFSWQMTNFGFYWPEQYPALLLTLAGGILFPLFARKDRNREILIIAGRRQQLAGISLLALYCILPLFLLHIPLKADNHFTATLRLEQRAGHRIEIDRQPYQAKQKTIETMSGEMLQLRGADLPRHDAKMSIQGKFIDNHTILISKYHVHSPLRDIFSLVGISMLLISWLVALFKKRIRLEEIY